MKSALFQSLQLNMPAIADLLASRGRKGDTMLAHITPREAKMLMEEGGAGTINPETGLPEFYDGFDFGGFTPTSPYGTYEYSGSVAPDFTPTPSFSYESPEYTGGGYVPESYTPTFTAGRPETAPAYTYQAPSYEAPSYGGISGGIDFGQAPAGGPEVQLGGQLDPFARGFGLEPSKTPTIADTLSTQLNAALGQARTPQEQEGVIDQFAKATGLTKEQLMKGVAGAVQMLGGVSATRKAAAQGREYKKEQQQLASPYQERGRQLTGAAERGELTPTNLQQLQAFQARVAQGVEGRGGVGAAQAQNQIEMMRQQLLQQQYDLGLKISGIGDQINLGAIKTGMEADKYVNELTNSYFTNIARLISGTPQAPSRTITIS